MADIVGTAGDDTLTGTGDGDLIQGLGGNDVLNGGAGNDQLEGGDDHDQLMGEIGDDVLRGGGGHDQLGDFELTGSDSLYGEDGNDSLYLWRYAQFVPPGTILLDGGIGNDFLDLQTVSAAQLSITLNGGEGDDHIQASASSLVAIDAGAGADLVELLASCQYAVSLGAGFDRLAIRSYGLNPPQSIVVADFATGESGDHLDLLSYGFQNWDGATNPFATGHLQLVQPGGGADAVLRVDRDGAAGGASFVDLVTFTNVAKASLTPHNLSGFASDGSAPVGVTLVGTPDRDILIGNAGDDLIQGLGGYDVLEGGVGDDRLEGGDDADSLDGGLGDDVLLGGSSLPGQADTLSDESGGNDELYGEDGSDIMNVSRSGTMAASTVLLDGGADGDFITFNAAARFLDQVELIGGAGNDLITSTGALASTIEAGTGADRISIDHRGTHHSIDLGADTDTDIVTLRTTGPYSASGSIAVSHFQPGNNGDQFVLLAYLDTFLTNWDMATNPFATGHLQLVQSGPDAILRLDRDGPGGAGAPANFITFQNLAAAGLTAFNLGGFPSDGSVPPGQTLVGTEFANLLTGNFGPDLIQGLGGDDTLRGRAGNDRIEGGGGADTIEGQEGNDTLLGGDGNDSIQGGPGNDLLYGGDGDDGLTGNTGSDVIYAGAGNDSASSLDNGDVVMFGEAGFDWFIVQRSAGPANNILLDAGADGAILDFFAPGRYLDNVIIRGGSSNDLISVTGGASVSINAGAGDDRVTISEIVTGRTVTLGEGLDLLVVRRYPPTGPIAVLTVPDFEPGANGDRLETRSISEPIRFVQSGHNAVLQIDPDGAGGPSGFVDFVVLQNLMVASLGYNAADGYYSAQPNLAATPGADLLYGDTDGNEIDGLGGADRIFGHSGNDRLIGGEGNDLLVGGYGADELIGGIGDDRYVVDHPGDIVTEATGQGHDQVFASASYALTAGQEIELLATVDNFGIEAINLTGNELDNRLVGNNGANSLNGGGGRDYLDGRGGNDRYFVDHAADAVVEAAGAGNDIVFASLSYALAAGQEVETLATVNNLAASAINLTGNELNNLIVGNEGANQLDGGAGRDYLDGRGGNDRYVVDDPGDTVLEAAGAGNDTVFAGVSLTLAAGQEVETLATVNNLATTAIDLTGNAFGNVLIGNEGANALNGGTGRDYLDGRGGADTYVFATPLGGSNFDTILGFAAGADRIALDDAAFAGLVPGALPAGAFRTGTAALDPDDRILYDPAGGALYFDADGNGVGAAVLFAVVNGAPVLNATDFVVI